jgi:hypothetical protein
LPPHKDSLTPAKACHGTTAPRELDPQDGTRREIPPMKKTKAIAQHDDQTRIEIDCPGLEAAEVFDRTDLITTTLGTRNAKNVPRSIK